MLEGAPVIDVHHHFLPRAVFDELKAEARGARRLVNDRLSITLSEDLYNVESHLRAMDAGGVDSAILTYSGVSILGMRVCRLLNEGLAAVQQQARGRLYGAVHVPLQEPEAAPRELERGVRELGLVAAALPTSAPGVTLDQPALRPLWRTLAELDLPIILHPPLLPQGATTDYNLERACWRPFDTTLAAVRIMYGVFPEFPTLKFVLPHLGGTAVFLKGRIAMLCEPPHADIPPEKRSLAKTVRERQALGLDPAIETAWSKFYVDTAGTGGWAPAVQFTAEVVTPARMLFGSDYPLEAQSGAAVRELVEMVGGLRLSVEERRAIAGENARQLFRLEGAA
ncbi:MAG TPA: amidohydrolase family protein [Chloroflexota bacterium]|nr:amidohydrolase family protein [Chloroflexota bacterium]